MGLGFGGRRKGGGKVGIGTKPKLYDRDGSTMSVPQLSALVDQLGLGGNVRTKRKFRGEMRAPKSELVRVLQRHFAASLYGDSVPKAVRDSVVYRPMLASAYHGWSPQSAAAWSQEEWAFEEKVRGYRMLLSASPKSPGRTFSRYLSDSTFLPIEHPFPVGDRLAALLDDDLVADVELEARDSSELAASLARRGYPVSPQYAPLDVAMCLPPDDQQRLFSEEPGLFCFVVLDVLEMCGQSDLWEMDFGYREGWRLGVAYRMESAGVGARVPETCEAPTLASRKQFYDRSKELGWEGVVAKRRGDPYSPGARSDGWLKFKHLSMPDDADTVDAVASYEDGDDELAALLVWRPWSDVPHELGRFVRIPGGRGVVPDGSVVEAERTERGWKFVRMRPFKRPSDCVYAGR